jgi:hypothetical protein
MVDEILPGVFIEGWKRCNNRGIVAANTDLLKCTSTYYRGFRIDNYLTWSNSLVVVGHDGTACVATGSSCHEAHYAHRFIDALYEAVENLKLSTDSFLPKEKLP